MIWWDIPNNTMIFIMDMGSFIGIYMDIQVGSGIPSKNINFNGNHVWKSIGSRGCPIFRQTRVKIQNLSIEDTKNSKYLGEAPSTETSRWNQDILQDILKHWEAEALHKSLWLFGVPSIACRETLHTWHAHLEGKNIKQTIHYLLYASWEFVGYATVVPQPTLLVTTMIRNHWPLLK